MLTCRLRNYVDTSLLQLAVLRELWYTWHYGWTLLFSIVPHQRVIACSNQLCERTKIVWTRYRNSSAEISHSSFCCLSPTWTIEMPMCNLNYLYKLNCKSWLQYNNLIIVLKTLCSDFFVCVCLHLLQLILRQYRVKMRNMFCKLSCTSCI